jgi:hypothetical protein
MKAMMKKCLPILTFVLSTALMSSGSQAKAQPRDFDFSGFTRVVVRSGMIVEISQSETYRVQADGLPEDLERLRVEQKGDSLQFSLDRRLWRGAGPINITIQMPELSVLNLSGGATGWLRMSTTPGGFEANLSGGSRLEGELRAGDTRLTLSGGSRVLLDGAAERLSIRGSGGSRFDLNAFACSELEARLSGGSRSTVRTDGAIHANLSGGSNVTYYGSASLGRIRTSGGSRVAEGN